MPTRDAGKVKPPEAMQTGWRLHQEATAVTLFLGVQGPEAVSFQAEPAVQRQDRHEGAVCATQAEERRDAEQGASGL